MCYVFASPKIDPLLHTTSHLQTVTGEPLVPGRYLCDLMCETIGKRDYHPRKGTIANIIVKITLPKRK